MILIEIFRNLLLATLLSMVRFTVIFMILPFMGDQYIQGLARQIVILSMSCMVIPMIYFSIPESGVTFSFLFMILVKEAFLGLLIGFVFSMPFSVAANVGAFIDTQRGASMGQTFDPTVGESVTTLSALFTKVLVLTFMVGGGFMVFLTFIYDSFIMWPIFSFAPKIDATFPLFFLGMIDDMMRNVVLLSAPVAITLFLVEFGLGMMNRFAPSLNVFSLAMPIKSAVAMLMFVLYMGTLNDLLKIQVHKAMEQLHFLKYILS